MKILIDTNIVLDLLLEREPFIDSATSLFEAIEQGKLHGYITATTITNIFYIIRKAKDRETAITSIQSLLVGLQFCSVDRSVVTTALDLGLKDFEDGIQLACATLDQLDAIVTRDLKDFSSANLPIWTVADLLARL